MTPDTTRWDESEPDDVSALGCDYCGCLTCEADCDQYINSVLEDAADNASDQEML